MSQPLAAACTACAKAKRKCGKQKPACLRCHKRGTRCIYPPEKPSAFILVAESASIPQSTSVAISPTYAPPSCQHANFEFFFGPLAYQGPSAAVQGAGLEISSSFLDSETEFLVATNWFAGPDTWSACQMPPAAAHAYSTADLKSYARTTLDWLRTWIDTGSNPFIHSHLYRTRYPPCVQDAYLAATAYLQLRDGPVTPARKQMVHRIIEEKMLSLLERNAVPSDWSSPQDLAASFGLPNDPLDHIARVHALMVYQLIGLFEREDTRLHHLAERHIPVLYLWMRCMVHCASKAAFLGECLTSPPRARPPATDAAAASMLARPGCDDLIWQTWIAAECMRRTWVIISGIQAVYLMVRHQDAFIPCMGGMMVTTRKGPWEAASAQEWLRICSEVNVGLVQLAEAHTLFSSPTAAMGAAKNPDEFIKFALLVGHGERRLSEWDLSM
ncbi:Transcription factor gsfR2 [Apiospora arundinis]|uniref:Transcription factor gsfR2 n=1 Tax=Apiospora arundinis TaxID=335852 RepID=A0ABR2JC30_9PEZI